jgi:radical SAM protein
MESLDTRATSNFDFRPFVVIWEPTRACDLACMHCRAAAQPLRSRFEFDTYHGYKLIDQIAELGPQVFVITGGDPLKRPDLYQFIDYARRRGLQPSLTPSATPLLTREAIIDMKRYGLTRLAVSLDASNAAIHDTIRGVTGSFDLTIDSVKIARSIDLPVQINTTVTRRNIDDLDAMIELLGTMDIAMWSVFFLVPTGRGKSKDLITAWETEQVFEKLYQASRRYPFDVKTTEAMHYRRYVLQKKMAELGKNIEDFLVDGQIGPEVVSMFAQAARRRGPVGLTTDSVTGKPRGLNDAKGFVFISHTGEVYPSGFFPVAAGNVRNRPLADIYRNSPLFQQLRDATQLKGKCGVCEFRDICGGSRARSFAMTGDPFGEEPLCIYQPARTRALASA